MNLETLNCIDAIPNLYGIFDTSVAPTLLYYAYIPVVVLSILIGVLVYFNRTGFSLHNKILAIITTVFSIYIFVEILLWITVPAGLVHFGWQLIAVFYTALPLLLVYFTYVFVQQEDLPFNQKIIICILTVPVLLLLPTNLNMQSFDIVNCESSTGYLFFYIYLLFVLSLIKIAYICVKDYFKKRELKSIWIMTGVISLILLLAVSDILGDVTGDYEVNLIGPIGMIIFIAVLSYLIVKFKAFNIKLAAAQVLVVAIITLIGSQLLFVETFASILLASLTLFFSALGGYLLVRSVKNEIKQREEIEQLASGLEKANDQLKVLDKMKSEFVSIASHQLRSPLTSIRGYSSMLLEGSFGNLSDKAKDAVERISESSRFMASSVEDYLNVSRIQAGNMKYEYSDFNLKDVSERVADDTRQIAVKKGLLLTFKSDLTKQGIVHADIGKTRQIIDNLVNNSLKYTPKGSINILVHDVPKQKKILVDITDTGIGMSPTTLENMFGKFERASNANEVNVTGTGLGLYIARKMAREMGGDVTAISGGEGKGSTFTIQLPLQM